MEGISDIKIVALDPRRPPVIRKEPYLDLYFELSHKVPEDWSADFNELAAKKKLAAKIKPDEGLFIETWVRGPDDIIAHLEALKAKVAECNENYIAKIALRRGQEDDENALLASGTGEQGRLNRIIAGLDFDT